MACPARVRALWRHALELASRVAGGPLADWRAAEVIAAEGSSGRPADGTMGMRALLASLRLARGAGGRDVRRADPSADPRPAVLQDGDGAAVSRPSPRIDARMPQPPLGTTTPADLSPVLGTTTAADPFTLDARLVAARCAMQTLEARIGRLLRVMIDHHFYRLLGMPTVDAYARERLGISVRKAWALVKLERTTARSQEFARAYGDGSLSWTRALALLPVLARDNAEAWIARARTVTVRRLYDEVNHVLQARDVLGPDVPLGPPAPDNVLVSPVAALVAPRHRALECSDLSLSERVQIGAHGRPAFDVADRARRDVCDASVSFTGPASVIALLRDVLDAFALPGAPRWVAFERLVLHAITHWESTPPHRDPVFARDGWRCAVPACSSRRNLHDHHVTYRSHGGGNERTNRVTVCAPHHLHAIHPGVIRAVGLAPADVRWEIGVRWNAPPLLTCVGDRICTVAPPAGPSAKTAGQDASTRAARSAAQQDVADEADLLHDPAEGVLMDVASQGDEHLAL